MKRRWIISLGILLMIGFWYKTSIARQGGILNQKAPSLGVTEWSNIPEGKTSLDIEDFKGKVVFLMCFQNW